MFKKLILYISGTLILHSCNEELPAPAHIEIVEEVAIQPYVPEPNINDSDRNHIRQSFLDFVNKRSFNGSILIAKNDEIIFDTVIGYANFRKRIPLRDTSAVQLASISKPITASVILKLIQEKKIRLEDTITQFLPRLPESYRFITVQMLLSHQTGLTQYYYYCDHYLKDKACVLSNDSLIEVINCYDPGFCFKPGRKFDYCNTNYALLAALAEKIEGKRFHEIVAERIIEPAGMKHSFLLDLQQESLPDHLVLGNNQANREIDFDYLDGVVGDKGFFSTAKDLFLFDRYLNNCFLLDDSLMSLAYSPQVETSRQGNSYGLGWRIRFNDELGKIVYHPGWWRGNRHLYFKIPAKDYTVIILSNALRGSVYNLNELLEIFYQVE